MPPANRLSPGIGDASPVKRAAKPLVRIDQQKSRPYAPARMPPRRRACAATRSGKLSTSRSAA